MPNPICPRCKSEMFYVKAETGDTLNRWVCPHHQWNSIYHEEVQADYIITLETENADLKKELDQLKAVASMASKLTRVYLGDSYSYPFEYVFDSMRDGDAANAVKVIYAHLQQEGELDLFAEELKNLSSVVGESKGA